MIPLFSLPGDYGIGDIDSLYKLVDTVSDKNIDVIQLLPMNAVGGDETSPYSSISSFALNPVYISLSRLTWLEETLPEKLPVTEKVDYHEVNSLKYRFLRLAWKRFQSRNNRREKQKFELFCKKQKEWLEPYATFHALAFQNDFKAFWDWPEDLLSPEKSRKWAEENTEEVDFFRFLQWIFHEQWSELKSYAGEKNICFMGDLPLYVSKNSSDHWSRPEMFKKGVHAGVPPDMYSEDGQDWGNPIYDWEQMKKSRFSWWKKRLLWLKEYFDLVRIDHFRGLYSYWEVKDGESPKSTEDWTDGPKTPLINALKSTGVEIIGEDLGHIPEEVEEWIEETAVPGYRVFLFGWGGYKAEKYRFCEKYPENTLACTSTHDSESFREFLENLTQEQVYELGAYLGIKAGESFTLKDLGEKSICKLLESPSQYVIIPLQDIFYKKIRINLPGSVSDANWTAVITMDEQDLQSLEKFSGWVEKIRNVRKN
jgi:4-alpha-glucanotransferase